MLAMASRTAPPAPGPSAVRPGVSRSSPVVTRARIAPFLPLQAKLEIGKVDDPLEREADATADRIVGMTAPATSPARASAVASSPVQRACSACEEEAQRVQRKCATCEEEVQRQAEGAGVATAAPGIVHDVVRSPGAPLDTRTRAFMEPRFGYDFGDLRVHTDARAAQSAAAIGARAYTVGRHLVFASSSYDPTSAQGRRLIAHELTHSIQQRQGGASVARKVMDGPLPSITAAGGPVVQRALVCSKPLDAPVAGLFARHAFVDDTPRPPAITRAPRATTR